MDTNTNTNPPVSIIIPAYNIERYLGACIRSVQKQDYAAMEMIIVNDGSTDHTLDVIRSHAAEDTRIRYIDKKNEGLPSARRSGIEKATGAYILHLDGDDTLTEGILRKLVDAAEAHNADIVTGPFYFTYPDKRSILSKEPDFETCTAERYYHLLLQQKAYWSVSANFHRRSLYTDHTVFAKEIPYGEDAILMTQLVLNARTVAAIQTPIFHYLQQASSICHTITKQKDYHTLTAYREWIEHYLKERNLDKAYDKGLSSLHIHNTYEHIYFRCFDHLAKDMKRVNDALKKYPDLGNDMEEKKLRLARYFHIAGWLGYWKLRDYLKRGRI